MDARARKGIRLPRTISARVGGDARLVASAAVLGLGVGLLLHRLLVALFERWDRLSVTPGSGARGGLLETGPWVALGVGVLALAAIGRRGPEPLRARRAAGVTIAIAGLVVLVAGAIELHVLRTLEEGWAPRQLWWDVAFHGPGQAVLMSGWALMRPKRPAQARTGTRAPTASSSAASARSDAGTS